MAVTQLVGAKIHRREDPRLITGHGHFIDDFTRQGAAFAAFVRSPFAHARVKSIDITDASKAPGVAGVYTARDFKGQLAGTHPAAPAFVAEKKYIPERFPIAEKEVCYQGEIVAAVLAETKGQAADAANLIQVEYEELPAVMDLEKAMDKGSPKTHEGAADNISWDLTYTGPEVSDAAFKEADVVVKERILQNRLAPVPMEPRGVLAEFETYDKKLTIWMSSQNPHFIRLFVSGAMGLKESQVRVISPDVGGGFGSKISPYPEDYLVPALSRLAERPVKWIETRTESIQNATHGRGQYYDVEVAAKKDGTLLGMRMTQFLDVGAYVGTFSAFQACACLMAGGAYKWKGISARTIGILTNRVPTDPYRGAGRPEATHLVERMVDLVALELKMDPVDIRRKNFIQPKEFPFTQNFGLVVDSGDYDKALDRALELVGYPELRKRQAERAVRLWSERRDSTGHRWHRARGIGAGSRDTHGLRHRLHGHSLARPGPRDDLQPDRGRPARRALRQRRAAPRRHVRRDRLRLRNLRQPQPGGGRGGNQQSCHQGHRQREEAGRAHARGRRGRRGVRARQLPCEGFT